MAKLSDLKPDKRNARRHSPRNQGMIEHSIQTNGFGRSVLLAADGSIIAGNATYDAAASAGLDDVLIVESDGRKVIAVKRTDVQPGSKQFHELAIADNRAAELAEWEPGVLEELSAEIDLAPFFYDEELQAVIDSEITITEGLTDPDAVPEPPAEPTTKPGDLWLLGRHRLLCGDSTVVTDVERLMDGAKADMVFTDPPYGMNLDASFGFSKGNTAMGIKATKGYRNVIGDDKDFDAGIIFGLFNDCAEIFLWGADYYVDSLPNFGKDGAWLVWDKKNEQLRNVLGLADFELLWSKQRHKRSVMAVLWNGALGTESEDTKRRVHPTQKPVRVFTPILEKYSKANDIIVDIFGGSGSTLIACEETNRDCRMMELDPRYCDVIVKRWEQFTGGTATLAGAS